MKKKRTFILMAIVIVVLGLLTVSVALAGQGTDDSLASVTGSSSNPSGAPGAGPNLGGTMLIDQQPNQSNGIFADQDCNACAATGMQSMAENFILNDTYSINRVVIWSGYFPGNSSPPDDLDVLFHNDNAGQVGTNISSESNVPSSRMQTGVVLFGVNEWMTVMTLTNPVELTAGTYWVEVFNNTAANPDSYFWEAGNQDPVSGAPGVRFSTSTPGVTWNLATGASALAFQLYGDLVVPQVPSVAISKNPVSQTVTSGGNATFSITVTNTGDVDLDNVTVSDPLVTDCDNTLGTLAVSATVTYGCQDTGVTTSYTNVVTVTSTLGTAPGPSATASAQVNVVQPTSVSLTGFGEEATTIAPALFVAILALVVGIGYAIHRKVTA